MEHKGTKILYTDRLILRPFCEKDIEQSFKNWTNDEVTCKYLTWKPHGSIEVSESVIKTWINSYTDMSFYQWAIEYNKEVIGTISIVDIQEDIEKVEVGYCIGSSYFNKGIVSEALNRIIRFFFEEVKINKMSICCDSDNIGSYRVMEKCGLIYEGVLREEGMNNMGLCDKKVYGMLREDYFIKDGMDYVEEVKSLIREYYKELDRNLDFQNIEEELENLNKYRYPDGEILVYILNNQIAGIVGYYKHTDIRCEMKRLFVKSEYRGLGIGDMLVRSVIRHAKSAKYKEMVLDTIEPLKAAIGLYHKYGFIECDAYYYNPMDDVIYMKKEL